MPFPEGMQLILVGLVLVLNLPFSFLYCYKSAIFPKFEIALMEIKRGLSAYVTFVVFRRYFFVVIARITLFITFWGFDSSFVKLIHEHKDIKYCCFFIVSSWLCLWFGVFAFPLGFFCGGAGVEYCNALPLLLVAFEIEMDPTGKSQVGRIYRFHLCKKGVSW